MVPVILHSLYKTEWSDWYNELFSYLGGTIGGIATLIAIVISTNQTTKIEAENYKFQQRNIRKEFADQIAVDVSQYIADIKLCYDMMEDKYILLKKDSYPSRVVSVQKAFLLRIKLENIDMGKEIINRINIIENNQIGYIDEWDSYAMEEDIKHLENATVKFIYKYSNKNKGC